MKITSYHQNLLEDQERLVAFHEAIEAKAKGIVFDLGTGSGVLAKWASSLAEFVYAVENDQKTASIAQKNLSQLPNISLLTDDARNISFSEKADLIICEMLDTALIDEEQVPVLNSVRKYLKKTGSIIPYKVFNGVEAVSCNAKHPIYFEAGKPEHQIMSPLLIYSIIDFKKPITEKVKFRIPIKFNRNGKFSGIKITTFTLLTPEIICGPTPMLNPPLIIPVDSTEVESGENIILKLEYEMGGGLNTIKSGIEEVC